MKVSQGDKVAWNWGNGEGQGTIEKIYERSITRKIKGTEVTRNGSSSDPALYIKQDDGDAVLKLTSEVSKA